MTWREQLAGAPADARIRVTRTIVYEGSRRWIVSTLARAIVQGVGRALINLAAGLEITCTHEEVVILNSPQIAETPATAASPATEESTQ